MSKDALWTMYNTLSDQHIKLKTELAEAKARIAELEAAALTGHHEDCMSTDGRLPHVLGKSRLIFCNCTIGLEAQRDDLKAQIKAAVKWCEKESVCIGDGGRTRFNWNFVKSKDILKILTSETGKGEA